MKTNFTKRLLGACRQVVMACVMISAIGISDAAAQTCTVNSNTVLQADCTVTLMADALVTGSTGNVFHSVTLGGGNLVTSGDQSVVVTAPGTYTYQITDASGCWGTFVVEDKSGPTCEVPNGPASTDDTDDFGSKADDLRLEMVDCILTEAEIEPYFDVLEEDDFNDCTEVERVYSVDESVTGCDLAWDALGVPYNHLAGNPYSENFVIKNTPGVNPNSTAVSICGIYKRTWFAVDSDGHVSEGCAQYVYTYRVEVLPAITDLITVECNATDDIASLMAPKVPTLRGAGFGGIIAPAGPDSISLVSNSKVCKYIATLSEGEKLPTCGTGYKQINTWTVIDWCSGTVVVPATPQLVVVEDSTDPTTSASGTISFAANPFDCSGTITVGSASGTDNCSPDALTWTTSISSTGGSDYGANSDVSTVLSSNGGSLTNVPIGATVTVSWVATDECGNMSQARTETFTETVDNRAPVAICNDALNVTLVGTNDGPRARVYAEDLDDTSKDNCGITSMEVSLDGILYGDYVTLECANLGEVTVYLRVSDAAGNSSVCWTTVVVEDHTTPVVTPPADESVTCLEELPAVGTPVIVAQGCVAPGIVYDGQTGGSLTCGEGEVVRSWTVTPPASNGVHASSEAFKITQTITIAKAAASWTATFPADVLDLECDGPNAIPQALSLSDILTDGACDDWRLNVEDKRYSGTEGDECFKLIRTYTLINWCTVNDKSGDASKTAAIVQDLTVDQDTDGALNGGTVNIQQYGKFSYSQTFKVSDNTVPTASIALTPSCDNTATTCNGGAIAVAVTDALDNCSDATIIAIDLSGEGVTASDPTPADGTMNFNNLASGTYMVTATVRDGCGNQTVVSSEATVVGDCKAPSVLGVMAFGPVMENCEVEVWKSDIQTSISDNCTVAPESAIELLTDANNNGVIDRGDVSTALFTNTDTDYEDYQVVTVTSVGANVIAIWVRDEAGQTAFALVPFDAQDNSPNQICSTGGGAAAAIAGKITNENNEDIDEVMVKFESSSQSLVEQLFSGVFNYSVPMSSDLTITPEKDLGYMNGVTTADLVKLQRHILGISSLSSAYQMIAADVNSDEKVNTKDMLHISRLILGLYDELPNSASWKFVSKDHQFANPSSPWGFPQAVNYATLESNVQADFVGIKIGDLTGNASPSKLLGDDNTFVGEMTIVLDETTLTAGQATVVDFKADDFTDFAGYQFTISLGENVKLTQVTPGVLPNMSEDNNFGLNRLAEGIVTTSWSNAIGVTLEDGAILFSLTIESAETVNLSDVISINSKQTAAEAYNNDLDVHRVGVKFNRVEETNFQLFQNQPNPFDGETMIGFNLPNAGIATLRVMNVAGQILITRTADVVKGYNQISLNKSDLSTSGVLYYQIETENHSATKKMVILE